jgi:hypothetical protein
MSRKTWQDPNGKHVRFYVNLMNSVAYRALPMTARALLFDMRVQLGRVNNGDISATLSTLKHRGWNSPATLAKALFELQALGFIAKTRGGGVEFGSKVCSLFRFTDLECYDIPKIGLKACKASNDFLRFQSLVEAEQALRDGVAAQHAVAKARKEAAKARKAMGQKKNSTLQNLKRDATESEALDEVDATDSVAEPPSTLQKLKQRKGAKKAPKSLPDIKISAVDDQKGASASLLQNLNSYTTLPPLGEAVGGLAAVPAVGIQGVQGVRKNGAPHSKTEANPGLVPVQPEASRGVA